MYWIRVFKPSSVQCTPPHPTLGHDSRRGLLPGGKENESRLKSGLLRVIQPNSHVGHPQSSFAWWQGHATRCHTACRDHTAGTASLPPSALRHARPRHAQGHALSATGDQRGRGGKRVVVITSLLLAWTEMDSNPVEPEVPAPREVLASSAPWPEKPLNHIFSS